MLRAFVGLAMPDEVSDLLAVAQTGLPAGRPVPAENLHLTLAFLGEQPEPVVEDIHHALDRVAGPPLSLEIEGVGLFGGGKPRSLHARIRPDAALARLRASVQTAARDAGVSLPREKFVPHVTLARFSRPPQGEDLLALESWVGRRMDLRSPPFEVGVFVLYRSWLSASGAIYEPLATYSLAA